MVERFQKVDPLLDCEKTPAMAVAGVLVSNLKRLDNHRSDKVGGSFLKPFVVMAAYRIPMRSHAKPVIFAIWDMFIQM